ncbi:MAG: CBS domain-containing protein [Acidobacteria bacterium]|nr:CBS domain-containing protein [Acidobacteriota bacterium]MBV9070249.1 CBS domain-containing protein [Acidobacteriota bacterium]MBV9187274.1 CBS domain-containing protein [Acidobacteriota bacterium]
MRQIGEIIEGHPLFHVPSTSTVRDAARAMSERNIGAIAVLDSGKLVGIFSERDVLTRIVAEGRNAEETRVGSVMTKDIIVAAPADDINDALQKMHECNCRHLPVVQGGNLVGMISIRDLLRVDDDANRAKATFLRELVTYSPDYET